MSLYADYIAERENAGIIENSRGFATFLINGAECYIRDIYVKPEYRKDNIASQMANEIVAIAKERGCKYLIGTVSPMASGATESLKVLLAYGFKLAKTDSTLVYMVKEI